MSQFDKDLQSAISWLVDGALQAMRCSIAQQNVAEWWMGKVEVVTACAELPGDMPLRVRCTPNVFNLKA